MKRSLILLLVATAILASAVPDNPPRFTTLNEAQPALRAFATDLPSELRNVPTQKLETTWPAWVADRDKTVRARLEQGEEDTITNLLRFGVTFTKQPRIDWPSLFKYGESAGVEFWAQTRADDLVRALINPGNNEHLRSTRAFLEKRGFAFDTPSHRARAKNFLLANLARMQKEFLEFQDQLKALRAANKLDEAKMLEIDSHLFANRGISLDTNIRPNFAIEHALRELVAKKILKPGSVRRVAIIGPGLDFVNKEEGVDFYPPQTIQPFAVIDSVLKLKLAEGNALQIVTYDISPSVNHHLSRARTLAAQNISYRLQIPWDATRSWSPEFASYWETFGKQVAMPARALPVPESTPELKMRALAIHPMHVRRVQPTDMNVVFQNQPLADEAKFDLVIGTNIFVYYGPFEQALAITNLSRMMRPGAILLSNNYLSTFPECALKETGRTSAPLSKNENEVLFSYQRQQ